MYPQSNCHILFLVGCGIVSYGSWDDSSLLCQVESEKSLESWAHALDEDVDLRPQQTEQERAKVDIELKAKEAWTSREEGIWGGL